MMDSPAATASRSAHRPPTDHPTCTTGGRAPKTPDIPAHVPGPNPRPDFARLRDAAFAEIIVHRADLLLPADRALLRAHFGAGITTPALASLATASGKPHARSDARFIRKRIRALADRVLSRQFVFVMTHQREWPPARRRAAQALVLHGMTLRDAAARTGLPVHALRRHADEIRALCEEAHRAETNGGSR